MRTTWYDTVATLSYLAAHTTTVNLLSVVWIAAYRHPLQTAKSFGTLDHLSGGRVIMGVGAGHVEAEFEALGVDYANEGRFLMKTLTQYVELFKVIMPVLVVTSTRMKTPEFHQPSQWDLCRFGLVDPVELHGDVPTRRWLYSDGCPSGLVSRDY